MSHDHYRPSERAQFLTANIPFLSALAQARQMELADAASMLQTHAEPLNTRLQESGIMPKVMPYLNEIMTIAAKLGVAWQVFHAEQPKVSEFILINTILAGTAIQFAIMDDSVNFSKDDLHSADDVLINVMLGSKRDYPVDRSFAQTLVSSLVDTGSAIALATRKGSNIDPNLDIYRPFVNSLNALNSLSGPTGNELDSM